jgi:hypothetical protein
MNASMTLSAKQRTRRLAALAFYIAMCPIFAVFGPRLITAFLPSFNAVVIGVVGLIGFISIGLYCGNLLRGHYSRSKVVSGGLGALWVVLGFSFLALVALAGRLIAFWAYS